MKLFWLKTPFTWIASLSELGPFPHTKSIKRARCDVQRLCSHLLDISGERVAVPLNEDAGFCEALVRVGKVTSYKKLRTKNGEERECHKNSALLWLRNPTKYKITTGYGLSDDGIWRRHSWIMTVNGDLIETTVAREVYFVIVLDDWLARSFADVYTN
jgi:hypothetical protein